jgi:hypothetical protein
MNQWSSQSSVYVHPGEAEVSAEFLLRLVPKMEEDDSRFIGPVACNEGEEVELMVEVAPCGEIVPLRFCGSRYES